MLQQNPQTICARQRLRSACAFVQLGQSSLGALKLLHVYHRDCNWAISWDHGTFRPPSAHSSNAHAQPSSGARCLIFGRTFHSLCVQTAKALARLHRCAGSPVPLLVVYVISTINSWAGSKRLCLLRQNLITAGYSSCHSKANLKIIGLLFTDQPTILPPTQSFLNKNKTFASTY